ncbi:MAG: hypothetical protein CME25_00480 [Gemmatimonadetes bacterium]|nr:hypothetical protein [Gemmatimonadota bacterium]
MEDKSQESNGNIWIWGWIPTDRMNSRSAERSRKPIGVTWRCAVVHEQNDGRTGESGPFGILQRADGSGGIGRRKGLAQVGFADGADHQSSRTIWRMVHLPGGISAQSPFNYQAIYTTL